MKKLVIVTTTDQVKGFRLAGINAIGVDDVETVHLLISSWLNNKEELLLAIDDSLFSQLGKEMSDQIYEAENILLVTIPDGPVSGAETARKHRIFEMIRHATGTQIKFKGESNVAQ
jgi:vacuolar-type H+-ATPase subunit F/Vma7